ncbi:glutathione S-transferase [Dendryphion nanum]|uniref:glutathione transferase n=1 Tax=Dendryphion nanum TaxID=256645 RepID=A0A9P9ITJ8_9PLEO|nr:glutathione S-transferase [Dendryphion nanum]
MTIIVYGARQTTRTQRVLFTLEKLKIPYELKHIDLPKHEHRKPEYVANHHPLAKVPAIEDNSTKLFESRAICRYLATKYPGVLSLPTDPVEIGRFEEAASVEYAYFEPAGSKLGWEKIFKKFVTGKEADLNAVAQLERELRQVLDYYEKLLADQTWLGGDKFSLIDVFHIPYFHFLVHDVGYEKDIESRPNVAAYWKKLGSDPAWKKITGEQQLNGF